MTSGMFSWKNASQASIRVLPRNHNNASTAEKNKRLKWSLGVVATAITLLALVGYAVALSSFLQATSSVKQLQVRDDIVVNPRTFENLSGRTLDEINNSNSKTKRPTKEQQSRVTTTTTPSATDGKTYNDWRALALELALLPAAQALYELETHDPFGTRTFEKRLLASETQKGAILDASELRSLFPCPRDRITLPDQRNHTQAALYRSNTPGYFLFFQHLRKAGGTNFCTLAKNNLPQSAVGRYYCMSDYQWYKENGEFKAGYLHHWSNEEIATRMASSGHRVTGNEWDNFDRTHHFELPAVFATSFRLPLDRALSQFRFECVEDRGCKQKDVGAWWKYRRDLYNIYTVTFADQSRAGIVRMFEQNTTGFREKRAELMGMALDTVAKFHLVLSMEWLAYAKQQVEGVLGFSKTTSLTTRVRPHIQQAKRDDGQEVNKLGAAGIVKASWTPKEYLTSDQYKDFSEHLALDEILTDAARRMFLERTVCDDLLEV